MSLALLIHKLAAIILKNTVIKKIFLLFVFVSIISFSQTVIHKGNCDYLSNVLIVKYKSGISTAQNFIQSLFLKNAETEINNARQMYPQTNSRLMKGEESISRIFQVEYNSSEDPIKLAAKISKLPEIEYAEPRYIQHITDTPNDSLYNMSLQSNLADIKASEAWDITKGNSSIIIAIVDVGVDWRHPDLAAHMVAGTDLGGENGTPDEDPSEDKAPQADSIWQPYHGTHVAGIASAVSNNRIGIASVGYNCSLMPVKVSRSDFRDDKGRPLIYYGFDGIKWAADHGAKIINCSWGGYSYSRYEQDIINYAANKGALVVAAQGNENRLTPFYPADYKNVLSVCWADNNDNKNPSANYGREVDVMAPGTLVLSTWPKVAKNNPNDYNTHMSGSSMASPLVAGLAGLVASVFPNYSPQQIAEQIRVTSDDVYLTNNTPDLQYLLGKGRINAYRAVTETKAVSVRITNVNYSGSGSGVYGIGDEVTAQLSLKNYLNQVSGLNISVQCSDSFLDLKPITSGAISIAANDTAANKISFKFTIRNGAPYDYDVGFLVKFNAGTYSDFQWLSIRINPTYANHNSNKISMSVTSKGSLGFTDFPANLYGNGFHFNGGNNLLFEGAFMYGNSPTAVMDAAREQTEQSKDFAMITPISITVDPNGKQTGTTTYNDSGAGAISLGIETKQKSYSYVNSPDDKYVIIVDELQNKTLKDINNIYVGYYFDWDLPAESPEADSTAFDQTEKFGYAFYKDRSKLNTIVGAALVSSTNYGYYPIDNRATSGEVYLNDGFTDNEKWITLSKGIVNTTLGYTDISFVVSGGPINIPAGKSAKIAFAVAAADNISDLRNVVHQSRIKYQTEIATEVNNTVELPTKFSLSQNYPNPFNPSTTISYQLSNAGHVSLKVYDLLGREVATLVNELKKSGNYNFVFSINNYQLSSGVYFYQLNAGSFMATKKFVLIK